ncbi:class I SAM-dependent methyltransferase [Parabacteroides provencensis]|uniref:class I SAM-dependent methyltransferase n=1 Tax=Parabacteroides provencensis TaxID=1944636 RepID=UPI000C15CC10|nr:class I SAM-dependent methyltransferase [Parabacteroides provencensis]
MNKYWREHWNSSEISQKKSLLAQVEHTYQGSPIVVYVLGKLNLHQSSIVLDLCSGNGLFSNPISEIAEEVTAVDYSAQLLEKINSPKIKKIQKDINDVSLPILQYDTVILYAGIQYFDELEALNIFEKVFQSLKIGGIFYVGDIPDRSLLWSFANTERYKFDYFKNLKAGTPAIGNWFLPNDLVEMGRYCGFSHVEILPQPKEFPYSHFKFDMRLTK